MRIIMRCVVSEGVTRSSIKIAGGTPGIKLSWQVTGPRRDPYANVHRMRAEENRFDEERAYYLHPELYGEPSEKMINRSIFSRRTNNARVSSF